MVKKVKCLDEVLALLDSMTPVYLAQVAKLPKTERRVLWNMAYIDQPARLKDIAQRARMEARACANCLTRLRQKGYIGNADRKWTVNDEWLTQWIRMRRRELVRIPESEPPKEPGFLDSMLLASGLQQAVG